MSDTPFIFCEGCGARLSAQDRSCPKCGHPAPGILSAHFAASDLAAGKTASFPRLSQDMIDGALPAVPDPDLMASVPDPDATGVLEPLDFREDRNAATAAPAARRARKRAAVGEPGEGGGQRGPRAKRLCKNALLIALCCVVVGGAWFVAADPLGVMPSVYQGFASAAQEAFPSRQAPEESPEAPAQGGDQGEDTQAEVHSKTLSEDAAFSRLTAIYDRIRGFQESLGPVIDAYNGYYIASDRGVREENAQLAYDLRATIQETRDEISSLKLSEESAYLEDADHLQQLATWMYNRVDVLCRSWDISLGVPEGEYPSELQDEILRPLREVEMVDGKAIDVIEYESHVAEWKPQQK